MPQPTGHSPSTHSGVTGTATDTDQRPGNQSSRLVSNMSVALALSTQVGIKSPFISNLVMLVENQDFFFFLN